MKRFALTLILLCSTLIAVRAMSYEEARQQAWFLTDKMAYELNLTTDQYDRAYEINLDYLMSINTASDCLGSVWNYRDVDMRCILLDWQYNLYRTIDYFFRPIRWMSGGWYYPIATHYRYGYYYFDCPSIYVSYRGGRWRQRRPIDRSPYYGMRIERGYGMRDRYAEPRPSGRPRQDNRYDRPWQQGGGNNRQGMDPRQGQRPNNNYQGGNHGYQPNNNNRPSGGSQEFNSPNSNRQGSTYQSQEQRNNGYQRRNDLNQQRNNSYQQRRNSDQQRNNSYQQRNNSNQQRNNSYQQRSNSNQQSTYRNNRPSQQRSESSSRRTMQNRPSRSVGSSSSNSRQSVNTPSRTNSRQSSTRGASQSHSNNRSFSGR